MAVQIVRYQHQGKWGWGVRQESQILRLENWDGKSLSELIEQGGLDQALSRGRDGASSVLALDDVEILNPVTSPCSIVCQGKNYFDHITETGGSGAEKELNLFFSKASSSLTTPTARVRRPPGVELLDYELELGFVVKKKIDRPVTVREGDLSEWLVGVVMGNDISARDIQIPEEQWFRGKSFRDFCPVGPYLCVLSPAEFKRVGELELELRVNGDVRQKARVSQKIHPIAKTLTELSQFIDLSPGDLILTGTPSGVALQVKGSLLPKLARTFLPPDRLRKKLTQGQLKSGRFLQPGDVVTSFIRTPDRAIDLGEQRLQISSE